MKTKCGELSLYLLVKERKVISIQEIMKELSITKETVIRYKDVINTLSIKYFRNVLILQNGDIFFYDEKMMQ